MKFVFHVSSYFPIFSVQIVEIERYGTRIGKVD